ncbi:MAG TPA: YcaO-like family protein [Streptosporangiaceae bacterium]|nr:YcaO-like family protein [Streptosporangiaceae bacterium]
MTNGNDVGRAKRAAFAEAAEWDVGNLGQDAPEYLWGAAEGLPVPSIGVTRIPRCSRVEYATPGCPLVPCDEQAEIRWTRGTDLATGADIWVPAVMAMPELADRVPAEGFWHRVPAGYAVHADPDVALSAALRRAAEHDAIEVMWSQRLPLPLVGRDRYSEQCIAVLASCQAQDVKALTFDATTDIGVPTAFTLFIAGDNPWMMHRIVSATGVTLDLAAEKSLVDGFSRLSCARPARAVKMRFRDFTDPEDGMAFMGVRDRAPAFDFLVNGCEDRTPRSRPGLPEDPTECIRWLTDILAARKMQVVAVDRTTPELARAGLTAYSAVVPGLQPMSGLPLARFRGHPRLYHAPVAMGYRSLPEEYLNPWPQPCTWEPA